MDNTKTITTILKGVIWVCLGVVFFSALFVSGKLFFPFIVTKTVAFNISAEVMFLAFLLLAWKDKSYKLRVNWAVLLIAIYLVILAIASLLGNDFYHSFWSNNERSDGILLLIHLFLFVWVLSSFLRTMKEWMYAFDVFIAASLCVSLVAVDQYLALAFPGHWKDHVIPSSNGVNLASTLGNNAYVGGYLVFGMFITIFMFFKRKNNWLKVLYALIFLIMGFVQMHTFNRGSTIGLFFGFIAFFIFLFFFYFNNLKLKITGTIIILVAFSAVGILFINKDSSFVKNNSYLAKVASIASTGGTAHNRLVTWGFAWKGIQQRPLLGYGQENFYQVFDRYFTTNNTEQWFDRSHDMIFDRTITGGVIGLIGYLSLLLLPFIFLWKYYISKYKNEEVTQGHRGRKFFTPVIFTILIFAYIIQNLFIFEALVTYIPLMMIIAFAGIYSPHFDFKILENPKFRAGAAIIVVIVFLPALYIFNLKPLYANEDFIKVLSSQNMTLDQRMASFSDILSRHTLGNQEYRRQYFSLYENVMSYYMQNRANGQIDQQKIIQFSTTMEKVLGDQIEENPHSVTNYLLLMRFYNLSYIFDPSRLNKALSAYMEALKLSYGRPQVHYEGATTFYYLGDYYNFLKQADKAAENYRAALQHFYQGADLNVDKGMAFDQLANFLISVKGAPTSADFLTAALSGKMNGMSLTDMTSQMIAWIGQAPNTGATPDPAIARKSQIKDILNAFLKVDPKNATLKQQLDGIK